jgi:hypothetical protein
MGVVWGVVWGVAVMGVRVMGVGVRVSVARAGLFSAPMAFALFAAATGHAQTPPAAPPNAPPVTAVPQPRPVTGFVSSYAILRTARAAGFEPLAPPLRDGTIYVLRATDYRGILMRVVLDARTGAIRDATRIVPADADTYEISTPYGEPPYGSPPYAPPPYEPPPYDSYGAPAEYNLPGPQMPPPGVGAPPVVPTPMHPAASVRRPSPPLPHPRPADLVTQQAEKTSLPQAAGGLAQSTNVQPGTGGNPTGVTGGAAAPAVAPNKTPPPLPFND